ncbi:MAG: DUF4412 domain-containing protein [Gemmatimonadales bacterium]
MEKRNPAIRRLISAVACCVSPLAPLAAQGFEGVVTWQMSEGQMAMTQMYKGSQVRMEMNQGGHEGVMLLDNSMSTMTMLMPQQKMYMTMNTKSMPGMAHTDDGTPPKLTATGKTETIAGRTCEVYRYAEEAGKPETMEMCVAKGMGFFMMGQSPMGGGGPMGNLSMVAGNPEYAKLYKGGFFPLRISRLDGNSAKVMMLAKSVEAKTLDASLFTIPAGFTEMKMGGGRP